LTTSGSNDRLAGLLAQVLERDPWRLRPLCDRHGVELGDGVGALVREIGLDGANTIASLLRRRRGVEYAEIARDVASKLKVGVEADADEVAVEHRILDAVLGRYVDGASAEDRATILRELQAAGADVTDAGKVLVHGAWAAGSLAALVNGIGQQAVAAVVKQIVLKTVGREAAKIAGRRAAAIASVAIPLLNVVMVGWTVVDLAGPAFRKTVPTVLEIALLRLEFG